MYEYFAERYRMKPDEVDRLPLYLGAIMIGALSPDHENLQMTEADMRRYSGMKKWKQRGK